MVLEQACQTRGLRAHRSFFVAYVYRYYKNSVEVIRKNKKYIFFHT